MDACEATSDDAVLALIVEITMRAIKTQRNLFDDPMKEPLFYARYILPWVKAGMQQGDMLSNIHKRALKNAS